MTLSRHDHLTLADIDALVRGEGDAAQRDHLATCLDCQESRAELANLANLVIAAEPAPPELTAELDSRILWNARKRAQLARRRPVSLPRWAALAASVVLVASLSLLAARRLRDGRDSAPLLSGYQIASHRVEDLDGNDRVDIRDAFLLARALDSATQVDPRWDVNADGSIDRADVDLIAAKAVSLGERS